VALEFKKKAEAEAVKNKQEFLEAKKQADALAAKNKKIYEAVK